MVSLISLYTSTTGQLYKLFDHHITSLGSGHRGGVEPLLLMSLPLISLLLILLMLVMRFIFLLLDASVDFPVALLFRKCLRMGMAPTFVSSSSVLFASSLLSPPTRAAFRMFLSMIVHICVRDEAHKCVHLEIELAYQARCVTASGCVRPGRLGPRTWGASGQELQQQKTKHSHVGV